VIPYYLIKYKVAELLNEVWSSEYDRAESVICRMHVRAWRTRVGGVLRTHLGYRPAWQSEYSEIAYSNLVEWLVKLVGFDPRDVGGLMTGKLTPEQLEVLRFIERCPDRGDGWRVLAPSVVAEISRSVLPELVDIEGEPGTDWTRYRLTAAGRVLFEWL